MVGRVEISHDRRRNAELAAEWLLGRMDTSEGPFRLCLSGGDTPRELYGLLSAEPLKSQIPWGRLELFFGDERFVPPTDKWSNFRMVYETLLSHVPITPEQVYTIQTEGTPEQAARAYEQVIRDVASVDALPTAKPFFNVVLLGLGADGHVASLFPGSTAVDETERWVMPVERGDGPNRVTLTLPAIASSKAVAFLVAGAAKHKAVTECLAGNKALPGARVTSGGEVVWFIDRAAAGPLRNP